ncbi:MAG: glutamate racemase [Clostridia bacterium]|nr:glutamate racemase [Clostridia bacterium]MBR2414048.1 glutamate racemase [Clostridia bacterium]MBR3955453.1 glutamate racemase [Clostridia bacterium]
MKKKQPIGVFDSGLGGLTVVKSLIEQMPYEDIIYFGDTARVPYGGRSCETIQAYACQDVDFLLQYDVKAVVIACNTADAMARKLIEQRYPLPVVGVVGPAAQKAVSVSKNKKIGVICTRATVKSGAYEAAAKAVDPAVRVFTRACPLLVPLVENGRFAKEDKVVQIILDEYLEPLHREGIDTLVLGCTHYPLLKDAVAQCLPDVQIICSGEASTDTLHEMLVANDLLNDSQDAGVHRYFVSDDAAGFTENAELFLGRSLDGAVQCVQI